jgi:electron transport complex protein RnfE
VLPPGAFLGLGLLIALKNIIDKKLAQPVHTSDIEALPAK